MYSPSPDFYGLVKFAANVHFEPYFDTSILYQQGIHYNIKV